MTVPVDKDVTSDEAKETHVPSLAMKWKDCTDIKAQKCTKARGAYGVNIY